MDVKEFFEEIKDITTESKLTDILVQHRLVINFGKIPETPDNLVTAIVHRQLALKIVTLGQGLKAQWQNYWLKCCLSGQISYEYIFSAAQGMFKRETDVETILTIPDMWKDIAEGAGQAFFKRRIIDWYLHRYQWHSAFKLTLHLGSQVRTLTDWVKLMYPRMVGATFIGFLPLITIPEFWKYPLVIKNNFGYEILSMLLIPIAGMSYLYYRLEYEKTTGNVDMRQPFLTWLWSLGYSFALSWLITFLCAGHFVMEGIKEIGPKGCIVATTPQYWHFSALDDFFRIYPEMIVFYAIMAQFIGIVVQFFWEEKNVTEPL